MGNSVKDKEKHSWAQRRIAVILAPLRTRQVGRDKHKAGLNSQRERVSENTV